MIVADTDVLIDALRGRDPGASAVARELERARLATTAITVFELLSGARNSGERQKVEALLRPLPRLPFDDRAGRLAAEVRRSLERQGNGIGMADYLIAATCLAHAATLLTRNREHFHRVPGLSLAPLSE